MNKQKITIYDDEFADMITEFEIAAERRLDLLRQKSMGQTLSAEKAFCQEQTDIFNRLERFKSILSGHRQRRRKIKDANQETFPLASENDYEYQQRMNTEGER